MLPCLTPTSQLNKSENPFPATLTIPLVSLYISYTSRTKIRGSPILNNSTHNKILSTLSNALSKSTEATNKLLLPLLYFSINALGTNTLSTVLYPSLNPPCSSRIIQFCFNQFASLLSITFSRILLKHGTRAIGL